MSPKSNDTVATLRIELETIEPLIWRRFAVRTSINLIALHEVIQAVMGWHNSHLWMLTAKDHSYGILIPDDDDWNKRIKNAATTALGPILSDGLKELSYVYDFGDGWQHRIVVGDIKRAEPRTAYPQFLGGERRCPPEDCGGIPGYYEFLEGISAKSAKKRKAALDWYRGPYDPNDIDEQQIVRDLKQMASNSAQNN